MATRRPHARPVRARAFAAALLGVAVAGGVAGCAGKPPPKDTRVTAVSSNAPEPFQAMRDLLVGVGRMREAGDAAAGRGARPRLVMASRDLLLMKPPHDLRREDIVRFLDARERFTEAVNGYGRAADGTDDAALWAASRDVEASYWAWFDAYRGRPTEGSI